MTSSVNRRRGSRRIIAAESPPEACLVSPGDLQASTNREDRGSRTREDASQASALVERQWCEIATALARHRRHCQFRVSTNPTSTVRRWTVLPIRSRGWQSHRRAFANVLALDSTEAFWRRGAVRLICKSARASDGQATTEFGMRAVSRPLERVVGPLHRFGTSKASKNVTTHESAG